MFLAENAGGTLTSLKRWLTGQETWAVKPQISQTYLEEKTKVTGLNQCTVVVNAQSSSVYPWNPTESSPKLGMIHFFRMWRNLFSYFYKRLPRKLISDLLKNITTSKDVSDEYCKYFQIHLFVDIYYIYLNVCTRNVICGFVLHFGTTMHIFMMLLCSQISANTLSNTVLLS